MRQALSILIILFFFIPPLASQQADLKDRLFFEGSYHYGFVMPHHDFMAYFLNKHVQGFQFNVGLHTDGSKPWHHDYNYPKIGIGFFHSGLGNDAVYGKLNALYFFFDRLYLNNNSRVNFGNRIAFGLGYITKRFDLYTNPFDIAIGSRLNVYINYRFEVDVRLTPLAHFKTGLGITHSSNGNFKEPNKGINIVTASASLLYSFADPDKSKNKSKTTTDDTIRNQFILTGAYGWKGTSRLYRNEFPVYALSFEYSRKISKTGFLGAAISFYIDKSLPYEIENDFEIPGRKAKPMDNLRIAFNFSYEMKMGRLSYLIQPGIYLKNSFKHPGLITNKIGLRYAVLDHWVISTAVKAHWTAIADVVEWGIGYKL